MKLKKLICILSISLILMILGYTKVNAATYNIDATSTNVNQDENVTINVSFTAAAWNITVSGDKITGDRYASQTEDLSEVTTSKNFTMDTSKEGKYTVTISGDITDKDGKIIPVNKSVTVNVTKKEEPQPEEPQPEQPKPEEPQQPEKPVTPPQNQTEHTPTPEPTYTYTEINNETMYVTTTNVNVWKSNNNKANGSICKLELKEAVTAIAKANNGWYKVKTADGKEGYVNGNYLTKSKPTESSIATLSKLEVNPGNLNETFSKDTLSYTMTVDANIDTVNVNATSTDSNAKVTVTGNTGLTTGTGNNIEIKVVAEDGISTKIYKIKVTKLASEDENPNIIEDPEEKKLGLSSLNIEGIKLDPNFKPDVYEYTATITDNNIKKLNINAIASLENAKIEITGADEIKDGENIITITVTSEDGEKTSIYQIIFNKQQVTTIPASNNETKQQEITSKVILAICAAIAIIAVIIIFIIIKKKENKKSFKIYEEGDYNIDDEDYNSSSKSENDNLINDSQLKQEDEDDDEDDDWGTPKRGFMNKFKKTGRHF